MKIATEDDLTKDVVKALRSSLGMSQEEFWSGIGLTQAAGSYIESGRSELQSPYRKLIFIRYVAGLRFDLSTPAGADRLRQVGDIHRLKTDLDSLRSSGSGIKNAKRNLDKAVEQIDGAHRALSDVVNRIKTVSKNI